MTFIGVLKTDPARDEVMARIMARLDAEQRERKKQEAEANKPSTRGARLRAATQPERETLDEDLQEKLAQLAATQARIKNVGEEW